VASARIVDDEDALSVRLLIADDHALVRSGLRSMLQREPGIEIVGEAYNGRGAVGLCRSLQPNLVLMDVRCRRWTVWRPPTQ
jgi:DNA-binding NarL/FixJ family response regulator